jgi:hypothetical protein
VTGDRYGASDLESVLGDHGCRPRSPAGIQQVGMEATLRPKASCCKRFVGCLWRVNTRPGRATFAGQEASGDCSGYECSSIGAYVGLVPV